MSSKLHEGPLLGEKETSRLIFLLKKYKERTKIYQRGLADKLGITPQSLASWFGGRTKRIFLARARDVCERMCLDYRYVLGIEIKEQRSKLYKQFVDFNTEYREYLARGDQEALSKLTRNTALLCYEILSRRGLPVTVTMVNDTNHELNVFDRIVIHASFDVDSFQIVFRHGLNIEYQFIRIRRNLHKNLLHEGVLSMSMLQNMEDQMFRCYSLAKATKGNHKVSSDFVTAAREFSINN